MVQSNVAAQDGAGVPAILVDGLPASQVLATADGWVEAGDLEPGDGVLTYENGVLPLRAVNRSAQAAWVPPVFWPVHLPSGIMGNAHPVELLPAQMVMLECDLAEDYFGEPCVMVPSLALVGWNGAKRLPPREVELVHLHFDHPQVVFAGPSLLLGCGGTGNAAANMFRGGDLLTLGLREARMLVAGLIAEGRRAALDAAMAAAAAGSRGPQAAFVPELRA
ncbi:Hint domain-containing protein [Tabrizicola sp. M-4]|uniref:Hint domain-containing protein n=1 Tax=Tabrizicola sp. M-4 TaxID=3055847 RepID=UPI003DA85A49